MTQPTAVETDTKKIIAALNKQLDGGRQLLAPVSKEVATLIKENEALLVEGYQVFVVETRDQLSDAQSQRNHGPMTTLFLLCDGVAVPPELSTTCSHVMAPKAAMKRLQAALAA